jgi:uncharacterized membrane protein
MVKTNPTGLSHMTADTVSPSTDKPTVSGRRLTLTGVIWISIIFGLLVSGYLSYTKLTDSHIVCVVGSVFDCATVTSSSYGYFPIIKVPVAYMGFLMYLTLAVILFFERRSPFLAEYGKILMFGIGLFGWLFSMWLVYVQFVLLGALCPWCLSHETNMTILFPLLCYRLWRDMNSDDA